MELHHLEQEQAAMVKNGYAEGYVSNEDFAAALRAHQAAIDATKSPQREAAELHYSASLPK